MPVDTARSPYPIVRNFDTWSEFDGEYYAKIPPHMQEVIRRYVVERIPPGDFLTAVIGNNLREAVNRADAENLPLLKLYVHWFYNVAPGQCAGSPEKMQRWLESKDLED